MLGEGKVQSSSFAEIIPYFLDRSVGYFPRFVYFLQILIVMDGEHFYELLFFIGV